MMNVVLKLEEASVISTVLMTLFKMQMICKL